MRIKLLTIPFCLIAAAFCMFGCSSVQHNSVDSAQASVYAGMSFEERVADSNAIVFGKVVNMGEPFMVAPVGGGSPEVFTDAVVEVQQVYKGLPRYTDNNNIIIRFRGGETEKIKMVDSAMEKVTPGSEHLFFLYRIDGGSLGNTEGDHYYVLNGYLGVYERQDDNFVSDTITYPVSDLDRLAKTAANVETEDGIQGGRYDIEQWDALLARGAIAKEEYNYTMSQLNQEMEDYAHVMTPEEQKAFEKSLGDYEIANTTNN